MLDTDGQADHSRRDAHPELIDRGQVRVGHGRRVLGQGFGSAEADGELHQLQGVQETEGLGLTAEDLEADERAFDVVETLDRQGLVDELFLKRLETEREGRRFDIDRVREALGYPKAHGIDYLLGVALPLEVEALRAMLGNPISERVLDDGTLVDVYALGSAYRPRSVGIIQTGIGNETVALVASGALRALKPRAFVYVGVATGIDERVQLCDVVVSTKVYAYEYGKDGPSFQPRPQVCSPSYALVRHARVAAYRSRWLARLGLDPDDSAGPGVRLGGIASGSKVVQGPGSPVMSLLQRHYGDAYALDMEGFGALRAAEHVTPVCYQVDAVEIGRAHV